MRVRYLVRKLEVIDGKGMDSTHSLVYFEGDRSDDSYARDNIYENVKFFPFDRERAGYVYRDRIVAKIINHLNE